MDANPIIEEYLARLARFGLKSHASRGLGITQACVNEMLDRCPEWKEREADALEAFRDSVEMGAITRARDGWDEPVFQQGGQVGTVKKFSDRLMEVVLKRHRPEYRDRATQDLNIAGGVLVVGDVAKTVEEWAAKHDHGQGVSSD